MEGSSWKTWLVVGALSVFGCSSLPHNKSLTYEKAVNLAVAIYNSKAGEDCVYRLLEVLAEPDWDPISESHQELNFTIKETMCLLGDVVFFDECDFKEDGVVRQCTGYYYFDERPPVIVLTCVVVGRMEEEKGEEGKKKEDEKEGKYLSRKDRGEFSGGKPQQGDDLPIRVYKEASWSWEPHQLWSSIAEEARMEGCFWRTLLVVGALAIGGTSSLQHKPLTYEEAVDLAVSIYNNKSGEGSVYCLLEAVPQPEWDPLSESNQELNFTIKETGCQVKEECSLEECDFEEEGVVMECTGYYFFGETPAVLVLTCEPVAEEEEGDKEEEKEVEEEEKEEDEKDQPRRVKRFKKFFKKLKKSVKKHVKKFFKKPKVIGVSIPF